MTMTRRHFNTLAVAAVAGAASFRSVAEDQPFRIGIVGSDNSHSMRFAELCNKSDSAGRKIAGAAVTHLWGVDAARNQEVAEVGGIPHVVADPKEMIGAVDGIICVRRHGSHHLEDARPFLEAGLPVFVDKPLASSRADAEALIQLAEAKQVGFGSFSTLRYGAANVAFVEGLAETVGAIKGGTISGPADPASEYDGLFFYAIHCVELMHATFGFGVRTVQVSSAGNAVIAVCTYEDGRTVTLELFNGLKGFHQQVHGTKASVYHAVDSGSAYYDGMYVILEILKNNAWPMTPTQLLEPVLVIEAIIKGMEADGNATPIRV